MEKNYLDKVFNELMGLSTKNSDDIFQGADSEKYKIKIDIVEFENYILSEETWERLDNDNIPSLKRKIVVPKMESLTIKFLQDSLQRALEIEDYESAAKIHKKMKEINSQDHNAMELVDRN